MFCYLRGLFPPWGSRRFELFDSSIYLGALMSINYIIYAPRSYQEEALAAPLTLLDSWAWGLLLSLVAAFGIVTSYSERSWVVRAGLTAVIVGSAFWCLCYLFGFFTSGGDARILSSALAYGWIASRLCRENGRRDFDQGGRWTCT